MKKIYKLPCEIIICDINFKLKKKIKDSVGLQFTFIFFVKITFFSALCSNIVYLFIEIKFIKFKT